MILINETDAFESPTARMNRNLRIIVLALTAGVTTDELSRKFYTSRTNISNVVSRGCVKLGVAGGRLGLLAHFIRNGEITLAQLEPSYLATVKSQFAVRSKS